MLVNHGRATGAQLLDLARSVAASVHERFGVALEPEPRIIGATVVTAAAHPQRFVRAALLMLASTAFFGLMAVDDPACFGHPADV